MEYGILVLLLILGAGFVGYRLKRTPPPGKELADFLIKRHTEVVTKQEKAVQNAEKAFNEAVAKFESTDSDDSGTSN